MVTEAQSPGNRRNAQEFTDPRPLIEKPTPKLTAFMQNKANLPDTQINVKAFRATDYDDFPAMRLRKNKANSKPIKANFRGPQTRRNLVEWARNSAEFSRSP
jgi:hypothetical protein